MIIDQERRSVDEISKRSLCSLPPPREYRSSNASCRQIPDEKDKLHSASSHYLDISAGSIRRLLSLLFSLSRSVFFSFASNSVCGVHQGVLPRVVQFVYRFDIVASSSLIIQPRALSSFKLSGFERPCRSVVSRFASASRSTAT